jgi:hypothetical protein
MWTLDMNRCVVCVRAEKCPDRKRLLKAISTLAHELNTDDVSDEEGGRGIIIVACKRNVSGQV